MGMAQGTTVRPERATPPRRLGLIGPAAGQTALVGRAADFLLNGARVDRAIYLGDDEALDRAVADWAQRLVGDDPTDQGAWTRAASVALTGTPEQIDRFVATERARLRLKALEALPEQGRVIETIGPRSAILIHDKSALEEQDILAATLLFYGKSEGPLVRRIGPRWFVTPGPLAGSPGGVVIVESGGDEVLLSLGDAKGNVFRRETVPAVPSGERAVERSGP